MLIRMIEGATRVIGKSQGYLGLPLRDELLTCSVGGPETPAMVSAWEPTPRELAELQAGAAVHLRVLGTAHPPVYVYVGPVPDAPASQGAASKGDAGEISQLSELIAMAERSAARLEASGDAAAAASMQGLIHFALGVAEVLRT
ncbi:hypothetical protein [Aureimonas ureilytica]|uniref:hypothetical protein n=1 Tax=Aureimonas ureilytica TaxID=401562 RepID=UPI000ACD5222|nr:hypothetical protein [Aureimonas ureilytica]